MKKTWTRLCTVLLALVLLAGLVPGAAAQQHVKIQCADISNIIWPTVGKKPQLYIDDSDYGPFEVARNYINGQWVQAVQWFQESPWMLMGSEDTFAFDKEYELHLHLKAKEGYLFPIKEEFLGGTIDGRKIYFYHQEAGGQYCEIRVKWYSRKPVEGGIQWTCSGVYEEVLGCHIYGDIGKLNQYQQRDDVQVVLEHSADKENWELWERRSHFQLGDWLYPDDSVLEHYVRMTLYPQPNSGLIGSITSPPIYIHKRKSPEVPVIPQLTTEAPYNTVNVVNRQDKQEYYYTYDPVENPAQIDWENEAVWILDTIEDLEPGKTLYVYTRIREFLENEAGTEVRYSRIYLGESRPLQDIYLKGAEPPAPGYQPVIYLPVNTSTELAVLPQPADANTWNAFTFGNYSGLEDYTVTPGGSVAAPDMPEKITLTTGCKPDVSTLYAYYPGQNLPEQYGEWRLVTYDPENMDDIRPEPARFVHYDDASVYVGDTFYPVPQEIELLPKEANGQFDLRWYVTVSWDPISGLPVYGTEHDYLSVDPVTGAVTGKKAMPEDTDSRYQLLTLCAVKGDRKIPLASCQYYVNVSEKPAVVLEKLLMIPANVTAAPGEKVCLQTAAFPAEAETGALKWTSSMPSVISVSSAGVVSVGSNAREGDTAKIKAAAAGGAEAVCTVTVKTVRAAEDLRLTPDYAPAKPGESLQIRMNVFPEGAETGTVTWTSSRPETAAVDSQGLVQISKEAKDGDSAEITAKTSNGLTAVCTVVVSIAPPAEALILSPAGAYMAPGQSFQIQAAASPEGSDAGKLSWSSSNPFAAAVDQTGQVQIPKNAVIGSHADIEVKTEAGIRAVCTVRIYSPDASFPFKDVPKDAWFRPFVESVWRMGLMNGHTLTVFGPEENLSRAQLAQILYNKEGKPKVSGKGSFTDVKKSDWFFPAVTWAADRGYVGGYGNGLFGPEDPITREQLATILWRYAGEPKAGGSLNDFKDRGSISAWAETPLLWAVENKIVGGKGDGILDPLGNATRAEVAKMIQCYVMNIEKYRMPEFPAS